MFKGFYNLTSSMLTHQQNLNVIANNMVNISTAGYKQDRYTASTFDDVMYSRMGNKHNTGQEIGRQSYIRAASQIYTDYTQGTLEPTGVALDFAIHGDGFFAVCRGRFSGRGHAGLDDRRDAAALGDVESGAPGHGREADGAAQAGRGVERDRRASCETSCADQVCTSGVGDAQVDRPRRRGRDRVAKLSAERGVLLRNLCECHWIVF